MQLIRSKQPPNQIAVEPVAIVLQAVLLDQEHSEPRHDRLFVGRLSGRIVPAQPPYS